MSDRDKVLNALSTVQDFLSRLPDVEGVSATRSAGMITESLLSELSGFSVSRLETMRRRGDVTEGVHWFSNPKGAIVWDKEAFDQWQIGIPAADTRAYKLGQTGLSVYELSTAGSGAGSVSTLRPRLPDSKQRRGQGRKSSTGTA